MSDHDSGHSDEHVYDDIRELDNPMPGWWLATFFVTCVFAYFYVLRIHGGPEGGTVLAAYAIEMKEHAEHEAALALTSEVVTEETLAALTKDTSMMQTAHAKFSSTCAVCHGEQGQGIIGPNLTDDYWKNCEGELLAIYKVIENGVPAKGMPAWGKQLSPTEVRQLAAYVRTLHGTNPANAKAAEGHLVTAAVAP